MGPGFESQRDHRLGYSNSLKTVKSPADIEFAGFFVFAALSKMSKMSKFFDCLKVIFESIPVLNRNDHLLQVKFTFPNKDYI